MSASQTSGQLHRRHLCTTRIRVSAPVAAQEIGNPERRGPTQEQSPDVVLVDRALTNEIRACGGYQGLGIRGA